MDVCTCQRVDCLGKVLTLRKLETTKTGKRHTLDEQGLDGMTRISCDPSRDGSRY